MDYNAKPILEKLFTGYHEGFHYHAVEDAVQLLKDEMLAVRQPHLTEANHMIKVRAALDHVLNSLTVEMTATGAPELLYTLNLPELDFTFSEPVYSTVPRLLLKVPAKGGPIDIVPTDKPVPISVQQAAASANAVLRFANEEGEQVLVQDRPIVQINNIAAGEFAIIGKIPLAARDAVSQVVADVMAAPHDTDPFAVFDAKGTVEQLGQILTGLRNLGYSNQYNTDDAYRKTLAGIADTHGAEVNENKVSGFYEKPSQHIRAALLHLVGDFNMLSGGRAQEIVRGNGYALAEMGKDGLRDRRPISADYAHTFNSRVSDEPLDPANEMISLPSFKADHPLADFAESFNRFTARLAVINAQYARHDAPPPAKLVANL